MSSGRILLVDQDERLSRSLRVRLAAAGYEIQESGDLGHAEDCLKRAAVDVVIVATKVAASGDSKAWRRIRADHDVPVNALATQGSERKEVAAQEAGADDYIGKPFTAPRLLACISAVLRRMSGSATKKRGTIVHLDGCDIDLALHRVSSRGAEVRLTPTECELLEYFIANANIPIPNAQLLEAVWGPGYRSQTDYIRTFVTQLRRKIERDPAQPRYLLTEPWVGYKFALPRSGGTANV